VATHPFCPVAVNISELVTAIKDTASYAPCKVSCHSHQRTVIKDTVVQEGLASILGLVMATSGCPVMDFFRPLARFHLPFTNVEESIFRVATAYMLTTILSEGAQPGGSVFPHISKPIMDQRAYLNRLLRLGTQPPFVNAIFCEKRLGDCGLLKSAGAIAH
jgi:hypothetical protein